MKFMNNHSSLLKNCIQNIERDFLSDEFRMMKTGSENVSESYVAIFVIDSVKARSLSVLIRNSDKSTFAGIIVLKKFMNLNQVRCVWESNCDLIRTCSCDMFIGFSYDLYL